VTIMVFDGPLSATVARRCGSSSGFTPVFTAG